MVSNKQGRVLLVGLNRPEKRNCLNATAAHHLLEALREFENDDSVDIAVLHGKGISSFLEFNIAKRHMGCEGRRSEWLWINLVMAA